MPKQKSTLQRATGSPHTARSDLHFPVVGIGASAGGVEALQVFFENAPASMDMAFVVVVHLAPEHASHVDDILQRTTGMPVRQVIATVPLEKNHVYVIAPGKRLEMSDGCLRATDRDPSAGGRSRSTIFSARLPRPTSSARSASCCPAPARTARRG